MAKNLYSVPIFFYFSFHSFLFFTFRISAKHFYSALPSTSLHNFFSFLSALSGIQFSVVASHSTHFHHHIAVIAASFFSFFYPTFSGIVWQQSILTWSHIHKTSSCVFLLLPATLISHYDFGDGSDFRGVSLSRFWLVLRGYLVDCDKLLECWSKIYIV